MADTRVKKALKELPAIVEKEMRDTGIPGIAAGVVYQDKVVFAKGFGVRNTSQPDKVDADTVFQLASVSKPVSSTVIAALVGEGIVSWDSKISDLDPGFELFGPYVTHELTVRDLYAHRSGLPDHALDLLEDIGYPRAEILRRARYQNPAASLRARYAYTNFGMTEGAVAACKPTGKEWEDVAQEKLFQPLGMSSTSARYMDFMGRANRASGHIKVRGKWVFKVQRQPDAQSPAGGVSSSVNDMTRWMRLHLNNGQFEGKQIVDSNALQETHHPHMFTGFSPFSGLPGFYGLGWNVNYEWNGQLRLNHSGGFAMGAGTVVTLIPSEQLGIVVLTNAAPFGTAETIAATFMDYVRLGKPARDWAPIYKIAVTGIVEAEAADKANYSKKLAARAPALKPDAYTGRYSNDLYGDIYIVEQDGGVVLQLGPHREPFAIKPWDRDTFTFETVGENAIGTAGITFAVGPTGKALSVRVENLDNYGQGTFTRVAD